MFSLIKSLLEAFNSASTEYQVKIGGTWYDNVNLGLPYNELVNDLREKPVHDNKVSIGVPILADMVLTYHGGPNYEDDYYDWEFVDFDVDSDKHDVIRVSYAGHFRHNGAFNGKYKENKKFSGTISIMPQELHEALTRTNAHQYVGKLTNTDEFKLLVDRAPKYAHALVDAWDQDAKLYQRTKGKSDFDSLADKMLTKKSVLNNDPSVSFDMSMQKALDGLKLLFDASFPSIYVNKLEKGVWAGERTTRRVNESITKAIMLNEPTIINGEWFVTNDDGDQDAPLKGLTADVNRACTSMDDQGVLDFIEGWMQDDDIPPRFKMIDVHNVVKPSKMKLLSAGSSR